MSFVVYEKESTFRIDNLNGGPREAESYKTMGAARAARTRFCKAQSVYTVDDLLIADSKEFYESIEKDRQVKSAMDGTMVTIKANTPWCCNPASERFWTM